MTSLPLPLFNSIEFGSVQLSPSGRVVFPEEQSPFLLLPFGPLQSKGNCAAVPPLR